MFEYPLNRRCPHPQWDTHNIHQFCTNNVLLEDETNRRTDGLKVFRCMGHWIGPGVGHMQGNFHGYQPADFEEIDLEDDKYHDKDYDPNAEHEKEVKSGRQQRSIREFPRSAPLSSQKWDCYDIHAFCTNHRYTKTTTIDGFRVKVYECLGHDFGQFGTGPLQLPSPGTGKITSETEDQTFHGNPGDKKKFYVYPNGKSKPDTPYHIHERQRDSFCTNRRYERQTEDGITEFTCLGHDKDVLNVLHYHGNKYEDQTFKEVEPLKGVEKFGQFETDEPCVYCSNGKLLVRDKTKQFFRCHGHDIGEGTAPFNEDTPVKHFHGRQDDDNKIFVYPADVTELPNEDWDTNEDINTFCSNHTFLHERDDGVKVYQCNGHVTKDRDQGRGRFNITKIYHGTKDAAKLVRRFVIILINRNYL